MIPNSLEEDHLTVWSLVKASSQLWRAALERNAPALASMGRKPQKPQTLGR